LTWRHEVKAFVERRVIWSGIPRGWRQLRRRNALILAYHNIMPDDVEIAGDRSLHLPRALFSAQLDSLQATHDVVSLETLLNEEGASATRPWAVVTFDDAYRGAMTIGVREVVARALPATVFVAPAFVGGRFFWWDVVTPSGADGPEASFREVALHECAGVDEAVRERAERFGHRLSTLPLEAACASENDLHAAARQPGITLASHSWSHPNLARLTRTTLEEELTRPLSWLGARFQNVLPVLSYPYGLSSPAVEKAAANAGYRAGVLVSGGWMPRRPRNPFALPRLNVPAGLSPDGFRLRTAGLC
jgi:peptidoglycan/xylan/chitin deacetylase (PgdA/CDA1 family)